jgi:(p)ppGpp synthase/HD superfamily hydrolase
VLGARFDDALGYASDLHRGQVRKGTTIPYVSHLLAVCAIVLEHGGGEDEAIAALLHDGPEDQGGSTTLEAIRSRFGDTVAVIVAECSDTFEQPKPPWAERKQRYLARLDRDDVPPSVLLVSAADKLHNLRSTLADFDALGDALWNRFRGSAAQQVWYYSALADVYRRRLPGALSDAVTEAAGRLAAAIGPAPRQA